MKNRRIISNSVQCLECGEGIWSAHRHDYVTCSCGKISVDGGMDYPTIQREAAKYGITTKSLRRAREKLQINPKRQGQGQSHTSMWVLPPSLTPYSPTDALSNVGRSALNGQESPNQSELFPKAPDRPSNLWER